MIRTDEDSILCSTARLFSRLRKIRTLAVAVLVIVPLSSCHGDRQVDGRAVRTEELSLSFRPLPLEHGERIVGLEIVVTNGFVAAIANIPADWSLHLDADPQWRARVSGVPHHGVGALTDVSQLGSFLTIRPSGANPIDIEATIQTTVDFERTKTLSLTIKDFVLRKRAAG